MKSSLFSRTLLTCFFLFLALLGSIAFWPVQAASVISESEPVLPENRGEKPGPSFFADSEVTLNEYYTGPVFSAGGFVEFSGESTEDLVVAGGTVRVSGTVGQDLYAAGGSVLIDGTITGNLILAGGEVQILPGAEIGGSVIAAGQRVRVEAPVSRSTWLAGESIFLSSMIDGDLQVAGESVFLTESASVVGNLQAVLDEEESSYHEASVQGEVTVRSPEKRVHEGPTNELAGLLYSFLWRLLFLGFAWFLFADFLQRAQQRVLEQPGKMAVSGMLWWAAVPLLVLVLLMSVIGVPLALLLLAVLVMVGFSAWTIPALAGVNRFFPTLGAWWRVVMAAGILAILGALPILRTLTHLVLLILGTGALWTQLRTGSRIGAEKKSNGRKRNP